MLDVPPRGSGQEEDEAKNGDGNQELEDDDHFPVPFSEVLTMLLRGVADPVGNEGADGVEHLPEGHDLAADFGRSEFADVDGSGGQCNALSETNQDTATDEGADSASRCECLHEGCDNDEDAADGHANLSTCKVCNRATEEETADDGADGVGSVDATDSLRALFLR